VQNRHTSSPTSGRRTEALAGSKSPELRAAWARVRRGTGRGGQGKLVGTLTDGRDVGGRPESGRRRRTRAACGGQVAVAFRRPSVDENR
jgi:hypothetical protein